MAGKSARGKPRNAFYAQSGGVTAVINASASGVIETARAFPERIGKVYAGRNGIIGALTEDLIDTTRESARAIAALRYTPSGGGGGVPAQSGLDFKSCRPWELCTLGVGPDRGPVHACVPPVQTAVLPAP